MKQEPLKCPNEIVYPNNTLILFRCFGLLPFCVLLIYALIKCDRAVIGAASGLLAVGLLMEVWFHCEANSRRRIYSSGIHTSALVLRKSMSLRGQGRIQVSYQEQGVTYRTEQILDNRYFFRIKIDDVIPIIVDAGNSKRWIPDANDEYFFAAGSG